MVAAEPMHSCSSQQVHCWATPPSQCIKAARPSRAPIQGVGERRVLLAAAVAAAVPDTPAGYMPRSRRPRGTAILTPAPDDAVSLQQLLQLQQQQDHQQAQQQEHVLQQQQQDSDQLQEQQHAAPLLQQQQQDQQQQQQIQQARPHTNGRKQQHANGVAAQTQHHQQHTMLAPVQQQEGQNVQQQPPTPSPSQLLLQAFEHVQQQQQLQQQQSQVVQQPKAQHATNRSRSSSATAPPQQQQQQQQQLAMSPPSPSPPQQQQPQQQQNGGHNGHLVPSSQRHAVLPQQQRQQAWQQNDHTQQQQSGQPQPQQQQQQQQRSQPFPKQPPDWPAANTWTGDDDSSSPVASSNSSTKRASAYSIVPTSTAPQVAQASAAAAAAAAAASGVARSRSLQQQDRNTSSSSSSSAALGSTTAAAAAATAGDATQALPPAEQCVPRAFWGLMNEELRPWHKEVLVQLCFLLPPPACYIYRDMRPNKMQQVLAQRALLEKSLRGHLVELVFHQQQIKGWLNTLQARQPRVDKSLNPDSVLQAQQQLLNLKADLGRTRYTLHTLQDRAAAYSDRDYVQYSQGFASMLEEMEEVADLQRTHGTAVVLQLQQLQESAARRVLFARTQEAVTALNREAAARAQHVLKAEQGLLDSSRQRLEQLRGRMQQQGSTAWRYPPPPYIAWRFKGVPKGFRQPWGRTPGVQRKEPTARQRVETVQQQQQRGAPPPLLGP